MISMIQRPKHIVITTFMYLKKTVFSCNVNKNIVLEKLGQFLFAKNFICSIYTELANRVEKLRKVRIKISLHMRMSMAKAAHSDWLL